MKTILGYLISFGGVILIYAAINLVLVGGQKLWYHGDQVKLEAQKSEIEIQRADIIQREAELKALSANIDKSDAEIAELKSRTQAIEQQYPSGIPQEIYGSYTQLIH